MPELPDLAILADAFHAGLTGRAVLAMEAPGPLTVRGTPHEMSAFEGQVLERSYRRGKFLWLVFERDRIAINAMLTGRLQLAASPEIAKPQKTMFVIRFGPRKGGPPADAAAWTAGADWSPGPNATPELRYRDPTQMGKIYLLPHAIERQVPGTGPTKLVPTPTTRHWTWRSGERASADTRASSRTFCATRSSWPASATPIPTRSSTRRGCSRSASAGRSPGGNR